MPVKEKEYSYEIKLTFGCCQHATSEKELIRQIKEDFYEEHNIELSDEEITNVEIMP